MITVDDFQNKQLVTKHNKLIEASYRLSTQEQRIILMVTSMIHKDDHDFKAYRFLVSDFMALIGVSGKSKYEEVKKITKNLRERTLVIKNLDENSETQTGWFSSFKYFDGKGYVQVRFDPELKPFLLNLSSHFTQYQLSNVIRLKSAYSVRIYELLKQYQNTDRQERYFELDSLKQKLGILGEKYKLYGDFKRKVLLKSQKEINKQTDLSFKFKEKKKVKKVIGLYFFMAFKKEAISGETGERVDITEVKTVDNIDLYMRLIDYFCLSEIQAKKVLKDHPEKDIEENLKYVEKKYKAGTIINLGAYTLKAIKENIKEQMSLFDEKKQKQLEIQRQQKAQKRRLDLLEEQYEAMYHKMIKDARESLSETELKRLEAEVQQEIEKKTPDKRFQKVFRWPAMNQRLAKIANVPEKQAWIKAEMQKYDN